MGALNTKIEEVLTLSGKLFHKEIMDGTNDEYKYLVRANGLI